MSREEQRELRDWALADHLSRCSPEVQAIFIDPPVIAKFWHDFEEAVIEDMVEKLEKSILGDAAQRRQ